MNIHINFWKGIILNNSSRVKRDIEKNEIQFIFILEFRHSLKIL